ncbi:hypothetical protein K4L44_11430 [Halosquirtibacter laminarini]|uniref:Uncharacterized protein n=1 Tax=Halosquirtibacter laminarini TaxID=3374600 RepID=A0AC61NNH8_9BACT|nr:hypothetical protein K4L44_11430 [Prolixibacteraceae bacterium]
MKKTILNLFTILPLLLFLFSCSNQNEKKILVLSYNVENLFDTHDDPKTKDDDFTPEGRNKWTQERYQKKIVDLSKVISASGEGTLPALIGLCEIENRAVLTDLVNSEALKGGDYGISQFESPYYRGMDVALLYSKKVFKVKEEKVIPVTMLSNPKFTTRDILRVKGELNGESFFIYVNHWSSRRGGSEKSEPKRMIAASLLRRDVDQVLGDDRQANIIIMGDMNEDPDELALRDVLRANEVPSDLSTVSNDGTLFNMMYYLDKQGKGTYNYHGKWNMLDNMIVSSNLLKKKSGYKVVMPSPDKMDTDYPSSIFIKKWFTYFSDLGRTSPSKTYGGPHYYGGFSDHYPIKIILTKE